MNLSSCHQIAVIEKEMKGGGLKGQDTSIKPFQGICHDLTWSRVQLAALVLGKSIPEQKTPNSVVFLLPAT